MAVDFPHRRKRERNRRAWDKKKIIWNPPRSCIGNCDDESAPGSRSQVTLHPSPNSARSRIAFSAGHSHSPSSCQGHWRSSSSIYPHSGNNPSILTVWLIHWFIWLIQYDGPLQFSVLEEVDASWEVDTLKAIDPDQGENAIIEYLITCGIF